jgi:hypothetical protein
LSLPALDQRYHVLIGQDAVGRDGVLIPALEPLFEPVVHRVGHRVGVAGVDAGVEGLDSLPQLVRDDRLGSAPALDALTAASPVEAEADRPYVPVVFRVDGGLVLAD